jgi:RNA polymerase sigma-70 factor (ECF subfamily)
MARPEIITLAKKSIHGDTVAFEELCRKKQRDIAFIAYTMLGNYHDAEDAAQETILMMYRSISQLRQPEAIDVWIERVVRSRCAEILRKRSPRNNEMDIDDETVDIADDDRDFLPAEYAEDELLSKQIYELVLSLSEKQREAILLYYYEDLNYKEISAVTGQTIQTVSTNLMKARNMLKKKLSKSDAHNKAALATMPASATALGRVLKDQSTIVMPDDKLAVIEGRWTEAIKTMHMPAGQSRHILKSAIGAAAVAVVFLGVVFGIMTFGDANASAGDLATPTDTSGISAEIIFWDGDCECGHINPKSVAISDADGKVYETKWEISLADGGDVLFVGNEAEASAKLRALESTDQDGKYLITCILSDSKGDAGKLSRPFTIGNYTGDA